MTFTPRQLEAAAHHLSAAARHVYDVIANPSLTTMGDQMRSSLLVGELEKAARALGYRLEKNGGHHHDEDGSD